MSSSTALTPTLTLPPTASTLTRLCARPWVEFFHRQLVPWVHYVPVRADLADLVQAQHDVT